MCHSILVNHGAGWTWGLRLCGWPALKPGWSNWDMGGSRDRSTARREECPDLIHSVHAPIVAVPGPAVEGRRSGHDATLVSLVDGPHRVDVRGRRARRGPPSDAPRTGSTARSPGASGSSCTSTPTAGPRRWRTCTWRVPGRFAMTSDEIRAPGPARAASPHGQPVGVVGTGLIGQAWSAARDRLKGIELPFATLIAGGRRRESSSPEAPALVCHSCPAPKPM